MPDGLIWHKWQSYWTWISGFVLLVLVYYLGAEFYLIDPAVMEQSGHLRAAQHEHRRRVSRHAFVDSIRAAAGIPNTFSVSIRCTRLPVPIGR